MSTAFGDFNCPAWLQSLAQLMQVPPTDLRVCELRDGSSIVGVAASVAAQDRVRFVFLFFVFFFIDLVPDQILNGVAGKTITVPNAISVSDTSTGRVVTLTEPFPVLIVAIAAGVGMAIILVIILAVYCIRRQKRRDEASSLYTRLQPNKPGDSIPMYVPPAASRESKKLVKLVVVHTTTNKLDNVLTLQLGDAVMCEPADWANSEEWVWVISSRNKETGYFPREWLRGACKEYSFVGSNSENRAKVEKKCNLKN